MEIFRKLFCKSSLMSLFLSLMLMTSCSQESDVIDPQKEALADNYQRVTLDRNVVAGDFSGKEYMQPAVDKIFTKVIESDARQTKYLLFVEISNSESLPDEMYIKGFALTDDGNYEDELAGDGIYTVYDPIVRKLANQQKSKIEVVYDKADKIRVEEPVCEIRITRSGEPCAGGICPYESILGGSTWFCLCIYNCAIL